MRLFFLVLLILGIPFSVHALDPRAMLIVDFFSYDDESGQRSIENHLEAEFSRYYELKSKEEVEGAELKVAEKIDTENCSDKECYKMMGEGLDVDYSLFLEIVVSDYEWSIKGIREDRAGLSSINNLICYILLILDFYVINLLNHSYL